MPQLIMNEDKFSLFTKYITSYTNVLLKTSFIGTEYSLYYNISDISITSIDIRQTINIPAGDHINLLSMYDREYEEIFNSIDTDTNINKIFLENVLLEFNVQNETNEPFGYCNELVDITLERK